MIAGGTTLHMASSVQNEELETPRLIPDLLLWHMSYGGKAPFYTSYRATRWGPGYCEGGLQEAPSNATAMGGWYTASALL